MNEKTEQLALVTIPSQPMTLQTVVESSENRVATIDTIGQWVAKSGVFGCQNQDQGKIIAITCMETRIGLVEFSRTYDIVENRIRKKALAALAEFETRGGVWDWIQSGDDAVPNAPLQQAAVLHLEWKNRKRDYRYSLEDAKREGLVKAGSRYEKRPGNMLRARCITNGLGMVAPDIFAGQLDDDNEQPTREIQLAPVHPATVAAEPPREKTANAVVVVAPVTPPTTAVPAATVPAAAAVIDVQKVDAQPAPAPAAAVQTATPPSPAQPPATAVVVAPVELQQKFAALIDAEMKSNPGFMAACDRWLRSKHQSLNDTPWLVAGQSIEDLTEPRMRRIVNQFPGWRGKVLQFAEVKP